MGYYDGEPQAAEAATIEDPAVQAQSIDAAISEDLESDLGDGLRATRRTRREFGW